MEIEERNKKIVEMNHMGMVMPQIAKHFNISRERVRQILQKEMGGNHKLNNRKAIIVVCRNCGKSFRTVPSQRKVYCTNDCYISSKPILTAEEKKKRYNEKYRRYRLTPNGKKVIKKIQNKQNNKYHKKYLARAILNYNVKKNLIIKPKECSVCNKQGLMHGHHFDYNKPLDVIWVCPQCHKNLHKKLST